VFNTNPHWLREVRTYRNFW